MPKSLEQIVLDSRITDATRLERAKRESLARSVSLAAALIDLGYVEQNALAKLIASATGFPLVEPIPIAAVLRLQYRLPSALARERMSVPVAMEGNRLTVAMLDPTDPKSVEVLASTSGYEVAPAVAIRSSLEKLVNQLYPEQQGEDITLFSSMRGLSLDLGDAQTPAVEATAPVTKVKRIASSAAPLPTADSEVAPSLERPDREYGTMISWPADEPDLREATAPAGSGLPRPVEIRLDMIESHLMEIFRIVATMQSRLDAIETRLRKLPN